MRLVCYGRLGELIGREIEVDTPGRSCTVAELRALLASLYPDAADELRRPALRACVGDALVDEGFRIEGEATVELFPPLSGGAA